MQCDRSRRYFHVFFAVCITSHILNRTNHNQRNWRDRIFYLKMFWDMEGEESKTVITLIVLEKSKIQINHSKYKLIFILKHKYSSRDLQILPVPLHHSDFSNNSGTKLSHMVLHSFSQHLKECFYVKKLVPESTTCWFVKEHTLYIKSGYILIVVYLFHNYPFSCFPVAPNAFDDRVFTMIHLQYW